MRTPLLLAAACTGLVLLAGCGDDGSSTAGDAEGGSASTSTDPSASADPSATDSPSPSQTPSSTPSSTPSGPPLPDCASVWVDGQDLPARYAGCTEDGTEVAADSRSCAFGRPLVIYGDRFYAVPGARVNETAGPVRQDQTYTEALQSCSG